ncbi:MAG TPA: SNF2-related protein [Clostridia bacterium]
MNISVNGGIVTLTDFGNKYYTLADTKLFRYNPNKRALEGRLNIPTLEAIERVNNGLPQELRLLKQHFIVQREAVKAALQEANPNLIVKCDINAALLKHQIRGVNAAMLHFDFGKATDRGFAYFFDMGTGKTLTTIALMSALYNKDAIKRVLVVCPSSLIGSWAQEINKFAAFDYSVAQLMGDKAKRITALNELQYGAGLQIAIINYESTFRDGLFEALTNFKPDLIVCDESQRIKNHTAQQSKTMHNLGRLAKFRVILSGTPIQNAAIDIFSQYKFLDPSIFGGSFYTFRNCYAVMGGYQNYQIIGYRNMPQMTEKIYSPWWFQNPKLQYVVVLGFFIYQYNISGIIKAPI